MTVKSVVGSGPVTGVAAGAQYAIPLALLTVKDGKLDSSLASPLPAGAGATLDSLFKTGAISAGETVVPALAFKLAAEIPGAAGNSIKVKFANVQADAVNPQDSKVDVIITAKDQRKGLTVASIGMLLGTPGGGTAPGLLALNAAAAQLPKVLAAAPLTGTPLSLTVQAPSGTAFNLVPVGTGPLFNDVTVAIDDVDTGAGTFTLTVSVNHSANGIKLSDLDAELNPLVSVTAGPDGFAAPAAGTVSLAGGADPAPAPATPAQAQVLTS